ncbi:protein of unknown function (DUF4381) [Ulvibacter sp. MAR_2010_11]|uniref:BatD family protein n=1 Tax=Ulvibacter sp. MAR_2010_11 TaxID=1250229 RepID=UPI000CAB4DDC|nr:BatD family protein [Ulvibacter sp. MAR_2010_11]PKA83040.1 protein of unknown function (DUF4381) [Ulvibacter sp. MAR_2010_11]
MRMYDVQYKDVYLEIARRSFFKYLLSFIFCLSSFLSLSQVSSSIDSTQIKIGEELKYTIQVQADTTDLVVFPEGQTFLPLEVIESYKIDTTYEQAKYRLIKRYGLTQFDSGAYTIPPQRVFINEKQFATDSIKVEVRDVAVDTTKQKMFNIKPAIEVESPPFDFLKLLYWLLPILLLLGILGYVLFRRKKRKEAEEKQLPPYEEAIVALKKLDSSDLLKHHKSKEYYSQLTEIVKRYLDREVDDAALESTSDELIARLQLHKDAGHFDFDTETIRHLDQILKRADLVKFAKMQQDAGQAEADRKTIEEIITETHEVIPEPSEEELLLNEEYLRTQRLKKRNKRILLGVVSGVLVILLVGGIFTATRGWSYVKDNLIGHPTKDLLEGTWVRSEYGVPAIIVETPKVLVRTPMNISEEGQQITLSNDLFQYGSLLDKFYILLNVATYQEGVELDFDVISEGILKSLEQEGATNIIVKKESFSTDKGVEGEKIYGEFDFAKPSENGNSERMDYEILLFKKGQSLQVVGIYFRKDDAYAAKVKERVINSVEIEVSESKKG